MVRLYISENKINGWSLAHRDSLKKNTHTHKRTHYNLHLTMPNGWSKTFFSANVTNSVRSATYSPTWTCGVTVSRLSRYRARHRAPYFAWRILIQVRLDWEFLGFLQKSRLVIYSILPKVYLFWTFSIIFSICQDSGRRTEELGHTRVRVRDSWTSCVSTIGSRGLEKITPPGKVKCMLLKEKK